jgi:hypothetical protein
MNSKYLVKNYLFFVLGIVQMLHTKPVGSKNLISRESQKSNVKSIFSFHGIITVKYLRFRYKKKERKGSRRT